MTDSHAGAVVFSSVQRVRCQELWAVLDAAGIPAVIRRRGGTCVLVVSAEQLSHAERELEDYAQEGPLRQPEPELTVLSGGRLGVLGYAVILATVAWLASGDFLDHDWFHAGRAQAGLMTDGQWWRALTALTLHIDARHLLGNLFFGSVFGLMAAQGLGGGVAWLAILAGGVLGNVVNALLQPPQHSAVGASTAVFAGLGLLVALALRHRRQRRHGALYLFGPLIAGVTLLAWTGMGGERTDVLAHVTGMLAGLLIGAGVGLIPVDLLQRRSVQIVASTVAAASIVLAWAAVLGH